MGEVAAWIGKGEHVIVQAYPDSIIDGREFAEGQIQSPDEGDQKTNGEGSHRGKNEQRPPFLQGFFHTGFISFAMVWQRPQRDRI